MSIMEHMDRQKKAQEEGAAIGKGLFLKNIGERIATYFVVFFIPSVIIWIVILNGNFETPDSQALEYLMVFAPPLILPLFIEFSIRVRRKGEGYDMNSNIAELVQYNALKEEAKKQYSAESEARSEMGVGGDKTDIRYWKGLLDDGIIDEGEFANKKRELL